MKASGRHANRATGETLTRRRPGPAGIECAPRASSVHSRRRQADKCHHGRTLNGANIRRSVSHTRKRRTPDRRFPAKDLPKTSP